MSTYSNFALLKPEELEVEYLVRGIPSNREGSEKQLFDYLTAEKNDPSKIHVDCHEYSSPDNECENIKCMVASLLNSITDLTKDYSVSQNQTILARNVHWHGRVQRLKHSFGELSGIKTAIDALERQKRVLLKSLKKAASVSSGLENLPPTLRSSLQNLGNFEQDRSI